MPSKKVVLAEIKITGPNRDRLLGIVLFSLRRHIGVKNFIIDEDVYDVLRITIEEIPPKTRRTSPPKAKKKRRK